MFGSTLHCPECRTALAVSKNRFFAQPYSTLLPGLWAVKRTGAWQRPAGLSPPEDLSSCPHCLRLWLDRLFLPGGGIIARQAATPAFGWVNIALHLLCRLFTSKIFRRRWSSRTRRIAVPPRQGTVRRCCSSPDMTAWRCFSRFGRGMIIVPSLIIFFRAFLHPVLDPLQKIFLFSFRRCGCSWIYFGG